MPATATTALLSALLLWPAAGQADTWQLQGSVNATAVTFQPAPREDIIHVVQVVQVVQVDFLNKPEASQWQVIDEFAQVSNSGLARARFTGQVGTLKAYAASRYPTCCTIGGTVTAGYSSATALGSFADTAAVTGASLAMGTPVHYQVGFDIGGNLNPLSPELGGVLRSMPSPRCGCLT